MALSKKEQNVVDEFKVMLDSMDKKEKIATNISKKVAAILMEVVKTLGNREEFIITFNTILINLNASLGEYVRQQSNIAENLGELKKENTETRKKIGEKSTEDEKKIPM